MKKYIEVNKRAYGILAEEYNLRWKKYLKHQRTVLRPFEELLKTRFEKPIKVLDLGCGVGLDSYILTQDGFKVHGLDISQKMTRFARVNAPLAEFQTGDFLKSRFLKKFHGIIMDAFIHLFPRKEINSVLRKVKDILHDEGIVLICATESKFAKEGYFKKPDYKKTIKRFRRFWTNKELIQTLNKTGFRVVRVYKDYEPVFKKNWVNVIFKKEFAAGEL